MKKRRKKSSSKTNNQAQLITLNYDEFRVSKCQALTKTLQGNITINLIIFSYDDEPYNDSDEFEEIMNSID